MVYKSINQFIRDCTKQVEMFYNEIEDQEENDKAYFEFFLSFLGTYFLFTGPFLCIELIGFAVNAYTIKTLRTEFQVLNIVSILALILLGISPTIYYGIKLFIRRKKWQQLYQKFFEYRTYLIGNHSDIEYINKLMNTKIHLDQRTLDLNPPIEQLSKYGLVAWCLWIANYHIKTEFNFNMKTSIKSCLINIYKTTNTEPQKNEIKHDIKEKQSKSNLIYTEYSMYAEYLNEFEETINELIRKQKILNNIPNNQALISKLQNVIDINIEKIEKLSQNTQLILELDDNTKSANTLKKVKDNQEKAQSIYEDIEKLIFKTMEVIESDDLNNEIQNNETFERILDDYQQSKF